MVLNETDRVNGMLLVDDEQQVSYDIVSCRSRIAIALGSFVICAIISGLSRNRGWLRSKYVSVDAVIHKKKKRKRNHYKMETIADYTCVSAYLATVLAVGRSTRQLARARLPTMIRLTRLSRLIKRSGNHGSRTSTRNSVKSLGRRIDDNVGMASSPRFIDRRGLGVRVPTRAHRVSLLPSRVRSL